MDNSGIGYWLITVMSIQEVITRGKVLQEANTRGNYGWREKNYRYTTKSAFGDWNVGKYLVAP